ncbi:MAG: HAMP domain-containing sensor histidine kinase [Elusimicrobia bacterium]|nr:HAMP domain-containing sensor histidine kinase [Elusimicrobiota bacterium]
MKKLAAGPRLVFVAQGLWLLVVFLLAGWWGHLIYRQASRIAELEAKLGIAAQLSQLSLDKTRRMVFWESSSFFALLLAATAFMLWLYWLDYRRNRSVQAFFASLTHELRTPLTSIRLQAEAISGAAAEGRPDPALIDRLLQDSLRLESQVERSLELARAEGGGTVHMRPVGLRLWWDRFISNWKATCGAGCSIEVTADIDPELSATADPGALAVIFRNLLENSSRHSRLPSGEPVKVSVTSSKNSGKVEIIYSDNGRGFDGDPKKLGRIFQKGEHSQGAGVGLYLVRLLAERMGGECDFSGAGGFRAVLELPEFTDNTERG